MPGSLQNKLQHFEISPPPGVWDKIASQLDAEYNGSDADVAVKLENASVTPPAEVWNKINASLQNEALPIDEERTSRTIPLVFRRIAAAAVIIGVLIIGGLYLLRDKNNVPEKRIVQTVPEANTPTAPVDETTKVKDTESTRIIAQNNKRPFPAKKVAPVAAKNVTSGFEVSQQNDDLTSAPEEAPLYELHTVSALQPVSISAPPLRDKKGNIILDASLISKPDDEYIIVTGPNGKQTRISSKFLSCLGYINAGITANDNDWRAIRCKTQFEEWRKRLLSEPAFIPTANNFFDIFELKDLLQEM
jgi:hypothetical protein